MTEQYQNTPPAGYLDVNGTLIHVAELRKYTTDIHRFRNYLPAAVELCKHAPHSPPWIDVVESAENLDALLDTVRELGRFNLAEADGLEQRASA